MYNASHQRPSKSLKKFPFRILPWAKSFLSPVIFILGTRKGNPTHWAPPNSCRLPIRLSPLNSPLSLPTTNNNRQIPNVRSIPSSKFQSH